MKCENTDVTLSFYTCQHDDAYKYSLGIIPSRGFSGAEYSLLNSNGQPCGCMCSNDLNQKCDLMSTCNIPIDASWSCLNGNAATLNLTKPNINSDMIIRVQVQEFVTGVSNQEHNCTIQKISFAGEYIYNTIN